MVNIDRCSFRLCKVAFSWSPPKPFFHYTGHQGGIPVIDLISHFRSSLIKRLVNFCKVWLLWKEDYAVHSHGHYQRQCQNALNILQRSPTGKVRNIFMASVAFFRSQWKKKKILETLKITRMIIHNMSLQCTWFTLISTARVSRLISTH